MMTTDWHVGPELLARYDEGRLDYASEAAVETHLTRCADCRDAVAGVVAPSDLESVWAGVSMQLASARTPRHLRLLGRAGLPDRDAVVLSASSLSLPWAIAVGSAVVCAMLTVFVPARQDLVFLLLAPLIPVLAVVAAHDATDPLRELLAGTPYSKLRLALVRTVAALAVALPVTTAVGLLVPGLNDLAFAWLLPGLCLTVTALALLTWTSAWVSGSVVSVAWTAAVVLIASEGSLSVIGSAAGQAFFAAVAAVMAGCLLARTLTTRLQGGY
jgi:hypothetical protein